MFPAASPVVVTWARNHSGPAYSNEDVRRLILASQEGKAGSEFVIPASGWQLGVRKRREPLAGCF